MTLHRILPLLALLLVTAAPACQVPVFRYALERWEPDVYALVIIPSGGKLSPEEESVADYLRQAAEDPALAANLEVRVEPSAVNDSGSARMELFYPAKFPTHVPRPIWSGAVTMENARRLIESPVRKEVVKRLLAGQSSVWILLNSGDAGKDRAAGRDLAEHTLAAKGLLQIPEGVVLHGDEKGRSREAPVKPEDVLHSPVPLMIDFSVIQISRDDPAEELFLAMLLNLEDDLGEYAAEPMAFPVFGRGRVREPLIGLGLNRDNVLEYSSYLCGACSCEVKEQNPGRDLLIAVNWAQALSGSEVVAKEPTEPAAADIVVMKPQDPDAALPERGWIHLLLFLTGGIAILVMGSWLSGRANGKAGGGAA